MLGSKLVFLHAFPPLAFTVTIPTESAYSFTTTANGFAALLTISSLFIPHHVLLQTINGLTNIQKGKITFNSFLHSDDIRKKQALVFQNPTLLRRNVLSNMEFIANIYKNIDKNIIQNSLVRCGLGGYDQKSARLLSGGEKQRLSLARALLTKPSILLLDEPTANLDPFSLKLIEDIILEENKKGTCIILTTHDMAQAKRLATNIIFMNKGEVIEQKNSKTFFNKPETNEALKYVKGEILL